MHVNVSHFLSTALLSTDLNATRLHTKIEMDFSNRGVTKKQAKIGYQTTLSIMLCLALICIIWDFHDKTEVYNAAPEICQYLAIYLLTPLHIGYLCEALIRIKEWNTISEVSV